MQNQSWDAWHSVVNNHSFLINLHGHRIDVVLHGHILPALELERSAPKNIPIK